MIKNKQRGFYKRFYIGVFDNCNLRCSHCFNNGGNLKGKLLSVAEIIKTIEQAQEYLGIKEVQLTGGEPLQRPDIFTLIRELFNRQITVFLQTNGVFNENIMDKILKMDRDKLNLIVSIDGIETNDFFRGRGVTDKIFKNLEILSQIFPVRINTLLSSKIKWDEIERLAQLSKKLGILLAFNPVFPSGRSNSSLLMSPAKYFEWMQRIGSLHQQGIRKCFDFIDGHFIETENCPVRKGQTIYIAADGGAYPCGFLIDQSFNFGSVRDFSLIELLERIPASCRILPSECSRCDFYKKEYCHGGCPVRIYEMNEKFDKVDIYCMAKYSDGGLE